MVPACEPVLLCECSQIVVVWALQIRSNDCRRSRLFNQHWFRLSRILLQFWCHVHQQDWWTVNVTTKHIRVYLFAVLFSILSTDDTTTDTFPFSAHFFMISFQFLREKKRRITVSVSLVPSRPGVQWRVTKQPLFEPGRRKPSQSQMTV